MINAVKLWNGSDDTSKNAIKLISKERLTSFMKSKIQAEKLIEIITTKRGWKNVLYLIENDDNDNKGNSSPYIKLLNIISKDDYGDDVFKLIDYSIENLEQSIYDSIDNKSYINRELLRSIMKKDIGAAFRVLDYLIATKNIKLLSHTLFRFYVDTYSLDNSEEIVQRFLDYIGDIDIDILKKLLEEGEIIKNFKGDWETPIIKRITEYDIEYAKKIIHKILFSREGYRIMFILHEINEPLFNQFLK